MRRILSPQPIFLGLRKSRSSRFDCDRALGGLLLMLMLTFQSPVSVHADTAGESNSIRIATYNASLYGKASGEIQARLDGGRDSQAIKIASIVQTVRPDVLLINEIDYDSEARVARLLADQYFAVGQDSRLPMLYPYIYAAPSNTGIDSGIDLNANGTTGEPDDAWGYGVYPGQYAMAVFSRFPIDERQIRTFQRYLWHQLPDAKKPIVPETNLPYYDEPTWKRLRLSSKNHIDVPVQIGEVTIHLLASHPTPPVFDGPEDRNGCRNHDEIRFWVDYLSGNAAAYLVDDAGNAGGLDPAASFVILGDLNADPLDGDGQTAAIRSLLRHPRLLDPEPKSDGGVEASVQSNHRGDPALDTADFGRNGHFRVDYVIPSRTLKLIDSAVFWPKNATAEHHLISASDHRLVWIEVQLP